MSAVQRTESRGRAVRAMRMNHIRQRDMIHAEPTHTCTIFAFTFSVKLSSGADISQWKVPVANMWLEEFYLLDFRWIWLSSSYCRSAESFHEVDRIFKKRDSHFRRLRVSFRFFEYTTHNRCENNCATLGCCCRMKQQHSTNIYFQLVFLFIFKLRSDIRLHFEASRIALLPLAVQKCVAL